MREHRKHRSYDGQCGAERGHDSLGDLLDQCSRFYAYRIGGGRRGQCQVLALLAQNSDWTQKELAEAMGVIPASLSELLAKLERKGLVERERDEADRRLSRVRLTAEGKLAASEPETQSDDFFQALSSEERETLIRLLEKLLADWEVHYFPKRKRQSGRYDGERHGHGEENSRYSDKHLRNRPEFRGGRHSDSQGGGRSGHDFGEGGTL